MNAGKTYVIDISFEEFKLPLHHDVLILGKNAEQGKHGFGKSLELLIPGVFQAVDDDIEHERIEAVFITKNLLVKISEERVLRVLRQHVFDHVAEGELVKVTMQARILMNNVSD